MRVTREREFATFHRIAFTLRHSVYAAPRSRVDGACDVDVVVHVYMDETCTGDFV